MNSKHRASSTSALQQVPKTPDIRVNVDRTLASEAGVTQQGVASDLLISLSSSNQTAPNYWLGSNGVNYSIYVQTPQYKVDTVNQLENTPITPTNVNPTPENTQLLGNLATTTREVSPTNVTHYDIKNTRDVLMNVSRHRPGIGRRLRCKGGRQVEEGIARRGEASPSAGRCKACTIRSPGWAKG